MIRKWSRLTSSQNIEHEADLSSANNYQNEESEQWIGEWMEARGVRDQMVIATKYTTGFRSHKKDELQANFVGNSAKSLRVSLEASLKKLKTDYIDILYVHWWDFTTSVPELMKALNTAADAGKIIYLGVSDTPAWIVSKANEYARNNGLRQFVVYQGQWSAANRDFERDIIPMVQAEGMALAPWGALGGGNFKSEEQRKSGEGRKMEGMGPSETDLKVSKVLEKIASAKGSLITSVALAYVMHKTPNVFPIVGGRKVDHLKGNIEALSLKLSEEEMHEIDDASDWQPGFPMNFLFMGSRFDTNLGPSDVMLKKIATHVEAPAKQRPIEPRPLR